MRAYVRLRLPDDEVVDLCPGDLIGRLWSAGLRVDNPRVSEAHALVSLRGQELKMLALRGVLAVDRKRVSDVTLVPGLRVQLARGYEVEVVDVRLPTEVFGLQLPSLPQQELRAPVYSVFVEPAPGLVSGHQRDAAAYVWSTGEGWRLQCGTHPSIPLAAGQVIDVASMPVRVVMMPLAATAFTDTRLIGRLHKPLRIVAQYDTVHIHREGEPTLSLGGLSARIVSELVVFDGPVSWDVVAEQIWRSEEDRYALRHKWDVNVSRLRGKLRQAGIRPDLIHADGSGTFELLLLDEDEVDDRT